MIYRCEIIEGWVFHLKERKSGAHRDVPSKNFWHSCNSAELSPHPECGSVPEKWVNACSEPAIFHCLQEEATLFFPPLCDHWVFNKGPFGKMNWENINMELMDDIFRSFVLQLVVVQVLRGSSTTFTHFFFFDDKDFLLWSFRTCFVQRHTGEKKRKKERVYPNYLCSSYSHPDQSAQKHVLIIDSAGKGKSVVK